MGRMGTLMPRFIYQSTQSHTEKDIPEALVQELRQYLLTIGYRSDWTIGELNIVLIDFRDKIGRRLLINQLHPFFVYLARNGELWEEE